MKSGEEALQRSGEPCVLVSVCCLCYNHEKSVVRMLESVLSQETDFPYEVILHDDASEDGTREVIEEVTAGSGVRIKKIFQTENQFRRGIDAVARCVFPLIEGKYIAFCEGDDRWSDRTKLQRQAEQLEAHPECSMAVHGTSKEHARTGKRLGAFPPCTVDGGVIPAEEYIRRELGEGQWMFHISSAMVRKELMDDLLTARAPSFGLKFCGAGDLPLFLYCLSRGDVFYISREMSVYRVDSGGFMTSLRKNRELALRVHRGYMEGFEEYDLYTKGRFHENVREAILRRKFEIDLLHGNFRALTQTSSYGFILKERKLWKRVLYHILALVG